MAHVFTTIYDKWPVFVIANLSINTDAWQWKIETKVKHKITRNIIILELLYQEVLQKIIFFISKFYNDIIKFVKITLKITKNMQRKSVLENRLNGLWSSRKPPASVGVTDQLDNRHWEDIFLPFVSVETSFYRRSFFLFWLISCLWWALKIVRNFLRNAFIWTSK